MQIKIKLLFLSGIMLLGTKNSNAQSVGIGTTTPDNTAVLDIVSNNKGVLIPRLTTAQRDAILAPANGLMIYNSSEKGFNFFNGTKWQHVNAMPKGAILLSRNFNDSTIINEGFVQDGYLFHDYVKQEFGDTTIPAFNWYRGNRFDENNSQAPACGNSKACYVNNKLLVFTQDTLFSYSRVTDSWSRLFITDPVIQQIIGSTQHVLWTGTQVLLWDPVNKKGVKYDPIANTWNTMSEINAPDARIGSKAIWTGTEMIIWGGRNNATGTYFNTGSRYNPITNSWITIPVPSGFAGRTDFAIVWTGNQMIIWGGKRTDLRNMTVVNPCFGSPSNYFFNYDSVTNYGDGRMYSPEFNNWAIMSSVNSPVHRYGASAIWADYQLVIAGGAFARPPEAYCGNCGFPGFPSPCPKNRVLDSVLNTGAKFDPVANEWTSIPPAPRSFVNGNPLWDAEQYMHIYYERDTILSFEPSADDWFLNAIPPLIHADDDFLFPAKWWIQGPLDIILLRPTACLSQKLTVFNLRPTPVTVKEIKSTTQQSGQRFYLYRKE